MITPEEIFADYDAGLLNDFGGGNVEWWQDYLRAEIGRANDFWRDQIRSIAAEREATAEAKAQEEYNAGMAFEEYGGQAEGACLYDLYAENRQFASQEPPRRNERGGWDYSHHLMPPCEV